MIKSKWSDYYNSEEELIQDMLRTRSDVHTALYWQLVKGYEYIEGFKRYYTKYGVLTDKQMIQLKRLAGEVYKNVHETLRKG